MAASANQCSHLNRTPSSGGEYCDTVTYTGRSEDRHHFSWHNC